jgi:hypothetical protein
MTRRTVFRLGAAAAAALAVTDAVATGGRTALAGPAGTTKGITSGNFRVTLGDVELTVVKSLRFGAIRTLLEVDPGRPPTLKFAGLEPSTTIELETQADRETELAKWYDDVKNGGESEPRKLVVELLAANPKTVVRKIVAAQCTLESFVASLDISSSKSADDRWVLRCSLAPGNFTFEES